MSPAPSLTPAESPALAETPDVAGLLAALDQPAATTPPFTLTPPAEIVGHWYSGTVSDINFTDPSGGWQNAGGEGEQYTFDADGTWQYGWLLQSSSGFCSTNVLVLRSGILASDEPDHILLLHAQQATITSRDSCAVDENYERDIDLTDDGLMWQRSSDEYGEVLRLRGPKTDYLGLPVNHGVKHAAWLHTASSIDQLAVPLPARAAPASQRTNCPGSLDDPPAVARGGYRDVPPRWHQARRDVGQRLEHEEPIHRRRVRHLQPLHAAARRIGAARHLRPLHPQPMMSEEQQVQVELTRTPAPALLTSERSLQSP